MWQADSATIATVYTLTHSTETALFLQCVLVHSILGFVCMNSKDDTLIMCRETFHLPDDLTEEEKLEPVKNATADPRIRLLNRLYAKKRKVGHCYYKHVLCNTGCKVGISSVICIDTTQSMIKENTHVACHTAPNEPWVQLYSWAKSWHGYNVH